jgi:hypothetical protein
MASRVKIMNISWRRIGYLPVQPRTNPGTHCALRICRNVTGWPIFCGEPDVLFGGEDNAVCDAHESADAGLQFPARKLFSPNRDFGKID